MKPIKINISGEFLDSYLYSNYLFIIKKSGEFGAVSLNRLFYEQLSDSIPAYSRKFIKNLFVRHDWLTNSQGLALFNHPELSKSLVNTWRSMPENLFFDIDEADFIHLGDIKDENILDLRFYANVCFISNRKGLFSYTFTAHKNDDIQLIEENKKSDARIIHINPKSGVLMLSAGSDGLLLGHFSRNSDDYIDIQVPDKSYAKRSIKTGWSYYDSINYESKSEVTYLRNEWETSEKRKFFYSQTDETNEKRELKHFSKAAIDLTKKENSDSTGITYFNTNGKLFSIKDNKISMHYISIDNEKNNIIYKESAYNLEIESISNTENPVLNAIQIPNGVIFETFKEVFFASSKEIYKLENEEVYSIRTFLTSRRYKRIICITKPNSISLHATFPEQYHVV
jgi:hypothetical protein